MGTELFLLQAEPGQDNTPPFYCKLIAMQPTQEFHFQPPTFFNIYIFLSVASAREKNLSSLNDNWLYYL